MKFGSPNRQNIFGLPNNSPNKRTGKTKVKKRLLTAVILTVCAAAFLIGTSVSPLKSAAAQTNPPKTNDDADGKFALLVGIDKYQNIRPLHGTVADVKLMSALLESDKFGFSPKNVLLLTDEQGTAENIVKSFRSQLIDKARDYKKRTGKEAAIFFQFSGHGSQARVPEGVVKPDEPDGYDETIVPVNSRDADNKYFDIIDDDISVLIGDLSRYTSNAVYVFDSCHSGTADRGTGVAREVDADNRKQPLTQLPKSSSRDAGEIAPANSPATDAPAAADDKYDLVPANSKYVMISGSRSQEKSYEKVLDDGTSHGALTYYLERALRNVNSQTSYRELMRRVSAEVSQDNPVQNPQVSGNVNAAIFGGEMKDAEIAIHVISSDEATVTIDAGKMMGIQEGSLVAFYGKDQARLSGDAGKIGEGEVTLVKMKTAVVSFSPPTGKTVSQSDKETAKAVLLSPMFGDKPLPVILETSFGDKDKVSVGIIDSLSKKLSPGSASADVQTAEMPPTLFSVSKQAANAKMPSPEGAISVRQGKFREVFCGGLAKSATAEDCQAALPAASFAADGKTALPLPADGEQIFYLTPTASGMPIFDFYVKLTDANAAQKINDALTKYARQRNLLSLENRGSSLESQIKVEMIEISGTAGANGFRPTGEKAVDLKSGESAYHYRSGTYYKLRITNNSQSKLYITALNISTDGAINALYPRQAQEKINPGVSVETSIYVTSKPYGIEQFKVIATIGESDYREYAQGKAQKDGERGGKSPLTRLMQRAADGGVAHRSGEVAVDPDTDQWAVINPFSLVIER